MSLLFTQILNICKVDIKNLYYIELHYITNKMTKSKKERKNKKCMKWKLITWWFCFDLKDLLLLRFHVKPKHWTEELLVSNTVLKVSYFKICCSLQPISKGLIEKVRCIVEMPKCFQTRKVYTDVCIAW